MGRKEILAQLEREFGMPTEELENAMRLAKKDLPRWLAKFVADVDLASICALLVHTLTPMQSRSRGAVITAIVAALTWKAQGGRDTEGEKVWRVVGWVSSWRERGYGSCPLRSREELRECVGGRRL